MSYSAVIEFPLEGVRLGIVCRSDALERIDFIDDQVALLAPQHPMAAGVVDQIQHFLQRPGTPFDLPLDLRGTSFQRRVWRAIAAIEVGSVASYGELAARLGSSARAVGGACGANPCPIVIPCHRVVAKSGLGGFMGQPRGSTLDIKRWLLEHERRLA